MREGSNVVIGLSINISAGDGSLESTGVARRSSMARCSLCFSFLHFLMIFLIVCTCLSMNPLDCGNLVLYAPLVDKVLEWFPDVLCPVITDDLVGSAKQ